ncbi:Lrp/AsnC family transcriptional regulator [Magnetovibrio sp.]|uniref:Lrp/AsnC family transcriptional regulator n=1 Tax=Magnetovibrio sp. TaxID=2024836 RepID=UPI002F93350E
MTNPARSIDLDATDRQIINALQGGLPICEHPYAVAATELGLQEDELIERLQALLESGALSRFGPMYHAERLGGGLTLAAMQLPDDDFERVNAIVNSFPEVAHNYARDHDFNMWFVLATETPERIGETLAEIEAATGHKVYDMPKSQEFYIGLRLEL